MKKSRNHTWLILGIITILVGLIVPFVAFNQSVYYENKKDERAGIVTFFVTITSKDEIKDIQNAIIEISYDNADDRAYEVYYIKTGKSDKDYKYEFKLVETQNPEFVDKIESIKLRTMNGVVEIDKKVGMGTKVPLAVFTCVIGAFMIFVNFFNSNSRKRTNEIKEIIAASTYNDFNPQNDENEFEPIENIPTESKNESTDSTNENEKENQTKECEYCGTLSDLNDKVCSSCGAKFKKK